MNLHSTKQRILRIGIFAISTALSAWCQQNANKPEEQVGFIIPKIELTGKLARIFTITKCKYIAGMTCHIHYKAIFPLPSQVFFTEFDEAGKNAGARVRLIYPRLKPGEGGWATFRLHTDRPAKVVLEAEWNGPWQNPY